MRPTTNTLFFRFYVLVVGLAFGLGAVFYIGGVPRFSGPSFVGARDLVGWVPYLRPHEVFGLIFLIFGLMLVGGLGRVWAVHVLRFGVALYLFFVVSLAHSAFSDGHVPFTGIVVYTACALAHLLLSDHLHARGWEGC